MPDRLGDFRVVKKLGQGGYGSVYLIERKRDQQKFILKRLKKGNREVLQRQFRSLQSLKTDCSTFFVCPHAIFEERGQYFMIMEYLEGYVELYEFIVNDLYGFNKHKAKTISKNIIRAVRRLHELGIAHRDLKPENIMIQPQTLDIRLIDFGMACAGEACQQEKIPKGTPVYMAPELFFRSPRQPTGFTMEEMQKTDLYSLGIIISILFHPKKNLFLHQVVRPYTINNLFRFYRNRNITQILERLNKSLVADPLDSTTLRLIEMDPQKRTLGRMQQNLADIPRFFSSPVPTSLDKQQEKVQRRKTLP